MCCGGSIKPQLRSAALTRSLLSRTAVSGKPNGHQIQLLPRAEIHFDRYRIGLDAEYGSGLDTK